MIHATVKPKCELKNFPDGNVRFYQSFHFLSKKVRLHGWNCQANGKLCKALLGDPQWQVTPWNITRRLQGILVSLFHVQGRTNSVCERKFFPFFLPWNVSETFMTDSWRHFQHGIGVPSFTVVFHELVKLMHHANVKDPIFFRIGTSGGIGVEPGTVVVSNGAVNELIAPFYEQVQMIQFFLRFYWKTHDLLKLRDFISRASLITHSQ